MNKTATLLVVTLLSIWVATSYQFFQKSMSYNVKFVTRPLTNSILHAKTNKVAVDNEPINEEDMKSAYEQWEEEEIEIFEREKAQLRKQLDEEDNFMTKDLPDYMINMLNDFTDPEVDVPVPQSKLPIIAVFGRPNTGKSTLVNRLTNSYKDGAIVHDEPGITRDRTYRLGSWCNYNFQVVDTGGIVFEETDDVFADKITQQALIALAEANAAIMVCDGQQGVTNLDMEIADWLRKNNKVPVYVAVSKCESHTEGIMQALDFWSLRLGNPFPVSGIHGTGIAEILDEITVNHMIKVKSVLKENVTNVALIGRPNVGKSSILNRLVGTERSIVSDVAGTTRDTIDVVVHKGNESYRIIDTAGIRKKGKIHFGPEFFMINRAFKAIRRSEVVVLVLDAISGIVDQDRILAQRIADEGRGCIIALNKWDAVENKDDKSFNDAVENIRATLPVLRWADVVVMSALTGQRTSKMFETINRASKQFSRRISTAILNEIVNEATNWMSPPSIGSRTGRVYYCMQVATSPPTIVFFVNDPDLFNENYQRYLERKIRTALDFEGTPIKLIFRGKTIRDVSRAARKGEIGSITRNVIQKNK